jgi:hypothetical protein
MAGIVRLSPRVVEQAKRLYCGIGLGPDDCASMVGDAIAGELGIHPHTLDAWIVRYAWRRPSWYTKRRPYRRHKRGAVAKKIGVAIERAAAGGLPFPSNLALTRKLKCSLHAVRMVLRGLVRAGDIRAERDGPRRRLRLRDGRVTAWSVLANADSPQEAKRKDQKGSEVILQLVMRAARKGDPCPTTAVLADRIRRSRDRAARILRQLEQQGAFKVDRARRGQRRIIFPDGSATAWPGGSSKRPLGIDYAATEAVTTLRRTGHASVFDVAVVTGKAWGVTWSVDGKRYDRDALIAYAAERRSTAMSALRAGERVAA